MFKRGCSTCFLAKEAAVFCRTSRTVTLRNANSRRSRFQSRFFQPLLHVTDLQCCHHFVELTLHKKVQIVQCQTYSMISNAVLRKIVGPDFFLSAARSDQAPPVSRILLGFR